jgi:tyrosyl-tRNA synthetase
MGDLAFACFALAKMCSSKSDARRSIDQKGVKVNDAVVESYDVQLKKGDVVQKGKRFFVRLK